MTRDDVLADLRPALLAWSREISRILVDEAAELTCSATFPVWRHVGNNCYARHGEPKVCLVPEARYQLSRLRTYRALEKAIVRSRAFAPMIGRRVGVPGPQERFDPWNVACAFMPDLGDPAQRDAGWFEARYHYFSSMLKDNALEYQMTCPIQGASFDEETIELAPGLTITRLTPDEVSDALDRDVLDRGPFGDQITFWLDETSSFALKKQVSLPIRIADDEVGGRSQSYPGESVQDEACRTREELRHCLALITEEDVRVTSGLILPKERDHLIFAEEHYRSRDTPPPLYVPPSMFRLDRDSCLMLQRLWVISHDESFVQNKGLALAVRRLASGVSRVHPEDRLLDVFIAAEAFYLSEVGTAKDRGELRYRLALRAAVWSEGTASGRSKREVFDLIKRGYDVRSAVAHGGEPRARDMFVSSDRDRLPELTRAVEEIVRGGLRRALRQMPAAGTHLKIPWDDVILSGPTGSP
jgi:hypothetical protein